MRAVMPRTPVSAPTAPAPGGIMQSPTQPTGGPASGPVALPRQPRMTPTPRGPLNFRADQVGMPVYHKGTDYVPKTGPAVLKKGEAVLNENDAAKLREAKGKDMKHEVFKGAVKALSGKEKGGKSTKEVREIRTRKGKSGGFIHEHHHTNPEEHPMEEHTSPDQDAMVAHMLQNMGTPNPGEAQADAGQGGLPSGGGAAPAPAAAGAAAPPAGM